jgi:fatty acid desaturase
MMVLAGPDSQDSLAEVLSARARATPPSRLLIDICGGAAVASAALWARPVAWFPLLSAAVVLFSYGVWAIAERRLDSTAQHSERAAARLELVQRVTAVLGIAGFLALLFGLLGVGLGPIIS